MQATTTTGRAARRYAIGMGAAALAVAALGVTTTAAARTSAVAAIPTGVIKHVVVIFQENRSFDNVLGDYCVVHTGRCDGSIGPVRLRSGRVVNLTKSPDVISPDIPHTVSAQSTMIDGGKMDGWADVPGCTPNGVNLCLTYFTPPQVPALAALADHFTISDHTFSMQDSPSYGGHVYAAAATQDGFTGDIPQTASGVTPGPGWGCDAKKVQTWIDPLTHVSSLQPSCIPAASGVLDPAKYPYRGAFRATSVAPVPTIFDRLDAKQLGWRLYSSVYQWEICPDFAKCLYTSQRNNVRSTTSVLTDATSGTLPAYSVVLPTGPGGTGQHPPSSMLTGDNWIGKVVSAIQHGPQWSSTAIFITYDDCGCFYDHVAPGVNADGTRQGPRVPMVIVSPYAKAGYTDAHVATMASVLRFTEEALGLTTLGKNDAAAYDYASAFTFTTSPTGPRVELRQQPVPASIRAYIAAHPELEHPDDDT